MGDKTRTCRRRDLRSVHCIPSRPAVPWWTIPVGGGDDTDVVLDDHHPCYWPR